MHVLGLSHLERQLWAISYHLPGKQTDKYLPNQNARSTTQRGYTVPRPALDIIKLDVSMSDEPCMSIVLHWPSPSVYITPVSKFLRRASFGSWHGACSYVRDIDMQVPWTEKNVTHTPLAGRHLKLGLSPAESIHMQTPFTTTPNKLLVRELSARAFVRAFPSNSPPSLSCRCR